MLDSLAPDRGEPRLTAKLSAALAGRREVRLALLFGSRARGRGRPGSDVDVAVLGDGLNPLALGCELSLAVGLEVEVLELDRASYPLLKAILRDGVVVHEGERHAAAAWRTKSLLEVETDRPWFERMRDAYLARCAAGASGR